MLGCVDDRCPWESIHVQLAPSWPAWEGTGAANSSVQGSCPRAQGWCSGLWAMQEVGLQSTAGLCEVQRLGTATVQHAHAVLSVLPAVLLCSACLACPQHCPVCQLFSMLCLCVYLPSVVGHVTEGFNLFTAPLLVIYPLYSLLSCII